MGNVNDIRASNARFGPDFTTNYLDISAGVAQMYGSAQRKLTVRPNVNMGIIGVKAKPTAVEVGAFQSFSMPVWDAGANVDEQLFWRTRCPFHPHK